MIWSLNNQIICNCILYGGIEIQIKSQGPILIGKNAPCCFFQPERILFPHSLISIHPFFLKFPPWVDSSRVVTYFSQLYWAKVLHSFRNIQNYEFADTCHLFVKYWNWGKLKIEEIFCEKKKVHKNTNASLEIPCNRRRENLKKNQSMYFAIYP